MNVETNVNPIGSHAMVLALMALSHVVMKNAYVRNIGILHNDDHSNPTISYIYWN